MKNMHLKRLGVNNIELAQEKAQQFGSENKKYPGVIFGHQNVMNLSVGP